MHKVPTLFLILGFHGFQMGRSRQTRRKGRSPAQKAALAKARAAIHQRTSSVDATKREATPEPSPKQAKLDAMRVKFKMSSRRLWKHYQKLAILSMTPEERDHFISSLKEEIERILAELEATQKLLDLQLRRLAKQRARVARLRAVL